MEIKLKIGDYFYIYDERDNQKLSGKIKEINKENGEIKFNLIYSDNCVHLRNRKGKVAYRLSDFNKKGLKQRNFFITIDSYYGQRLQIVKTISELRLLMI
jgi:hypothetical protein